MIEQAAAMIEAELDKQKTNAVLSRQAVTHSRTNLENGIMGMALAEELLQVYRRTRVFTGNDPETGKPQYVYISGRTEDERQRNAIKALAKTGRLYDIIAEEVPISNTKTLAEKLGLYIVPAVQQEATPEEPVKHNFKEYAEKEYMHYQIQKNAKTTVNRETNSFNRICEYFGDFNVEDITLKDVQAFVDKLANEPYRGKCRTKKTITDIVKQFGRILDIAVRDGLISINPTKDKMRLDIKGRESEGGKAIPSEIYVRMLEEISKESDRDFKLNSAIIAHTGMRPEEAFGLRWESIDFDNEQMTIDTGVTYTGKSNIKDTKTHVTRIIPIEPRLLDILKAERQEKGWIFHGKDGNPYTQNDVYKIRAKYKKFGNKFGVKNLHMKDFRTTVATILYHIGTPEAQITALLGHASILTTLKHYVKQDTALTKQNHKSIYDVLASAKCAGKCAEECA